MLRVSGSLFLFLVAISWLAPAACTFARAENSASTAASEPQQAKPPHFELYNGLNGAEPGLSTYSTLVWSPFTPVAGPGWRIRAAGAYSSDETSLRAGPANAQFNKQQEEISADLALGYQADLRFLWLKVYFGGTYRETSVALDDMPLSAPKAEMGATAMVESWWRLGERDWATLDANWRSYDGGVSVFSRAGHDMFSASGWPTVAAGLEAGLFKDEADPMSQKAGSFIQARWGAHEVTLSGGISREEEDGTWQPYASLSYGRKF
jgi:hypothetical protein